jgi:hypothetical protein
METARPRNNPEKAEDRNPGSERKPNPEWQLLERRCCREGRNVPNWSSALQAIVPSSECAKAWNLRREWHGLSRIEFPAKPFETSEKLPFIVAAVGRPPHFCSKLKSAALCREAATPVLQRSPFVEIGGIRATKLPGTCFALH